MRHDQSGPHRVSQSRPTMADQLERITPRLDALTQRARLGGLRPHDYHELETEAQAIASDLVAAFRGPRAASLHPPLYVSRDGTKAAW